MRTIITSTASEGVREEKICEAQQSRISQLKHGLLAIFIAGALALLITNPALAQNFALAGYDANGNPDADFGGDGKVTSSFGNGLNGSATAIAVDSSGRVVAVGTVNSQFALTRYKKDGSLDTTFGSGAGMVLTAFLNSYSASASAVAIDQQGRIVVAGTATTYFPYLHSAFALVRYDPAGGLDLTFGNNGTVQTDFSSFHTCVAQAVAIDGSGRIVAAGWAVNPVGYDEVFALARYKSDGSLDTTFDNDGQVTTNFLSYPNWRESRERLGAIAIDPLGRLVVAGRLGQDYGHIAHSSAFVVLRYKATGSLDTSFNGGAGIAAPLFNGNNRDDAASAVAIDGQGRIVVAGKAWSGASNHFALARLHHDGTLDHSFDGDGKVITSFGACPSEARAVMIDNSGKLLAAGLVTGPCVSGFALARYNVDGSLDNTFTGGNYNGLVTTDFSCSGSQTEEGAAAIAIQYSHPYGGIPRIILAGFTYKDSCRPYTSTTQVAHEVLDRNRR